MKLFGTWDVKNILYFYTLQDISNSFLESDLGSLCEGKLLPEHTSQIFFFYEDLWLLNFMLLTCG